MNGIKVVSFDVEGTLVTPDFSMGMWYECIPEYYGKKMGLSFDQARDAVAKEYDRVGDGRLEWYDVRHWFNHFQLGDYREAFQRCKSRVAYYPDSEGALETIGRHYRLIVLSASVREFLEHLIARVEKRFEVVISTVSDYTELKTPELYLKVCQRLGVEPSEVVHVGDNRQYDFVNPRAAGLRAFHLDRNGGCNGAETVNTLGELARRLVDGKSA